MVIAKLQPRLVRQKDAPNFFGVSRGFFDKYIRSSLTEIRWGDLPQSGVSYDVLEMHAFADKMVARNERPARKGDISWDVNQKDVVLKLPKDNVLPTCTSKAPSTEDELDKVLEQTMRRQQK
jgi:hypothetical protein